MEKMNRSKIISAPTFARHGRVMMIVLKITRRDLALVISLKIRPILNARATVAYLGPKSESVVNPMIRVMYEIMTIVKSKMFQPFPK